MSRKRKVGEAALKAQLASLGERLAAAREKAGLSYGDLARATGVSRTYLWQLEAERSRRPSADILSRVAAALGLTLAEVLGDDLACLGGAAEACAIVEHLADHDDLARVLRAVFRRAEQLLSDGKDRRR